MLTVRSEIGPYRRPVTALSNLALPKPDVPPEPPPGRLYSAKISPRACEVRFFRASHATRSFGLLR
jgi:hypothetical protein